MKRLWYAVLVAVLVAGAWFIWRRLQPAGLRYVDLTKQDPYEAIARATGGSVVRLDKAQVNAGAMAAQMQAVLNEGDYATLLSAEGSAGPSGATFEFLVDSSIETLSAVISGLKSRPQAEFRDAKDHLALPFESQPSQAAERFVFHQPEPGRWHVSISAAPGENLRLRIKAKTARMIGNARIVRPGGRAGHEGFFPYEGPLQAGHQEFVELQLYGGGLKNATVRLITLDGHELEKARVREPTSNPEGEVWARLHGANTEGLENDLLAEVRIPAQTFRVQVEGQASNGEHISRIYDREFALDKLALREFRSPKISETTANCAFLSQLGIFSDQDPKNPASAMLSCVQESSDGHASLTSSLSMTVPVTLDGTVRTVILRTPDYRKLTSADCDQTARLFERHPRELPGPDERLTVGWAFRCTGGPADFTGELDVTVRTSR